MKEYISKEAVMDALLQEQYGYLCEDAINAIPAADVVEVVRCGECEHWDRTWTSQSGLLFCPMTSFFTNADFYCADGERREEEQWR